MLRITLRQMIRKFTRARAPFVAALAIGCALGAVNNASAQRITPPATPALITPREGNVAFLLGRATGTQGYVCLPTSTGASWTVNNPRPEATLFTSIFGTEFEIITHFLSPDTHPKNIPPDQVPFGSATWQSSIDSSKVWAQVMNGSAIPAGSDPSCPNAGSIACLLLTSIGSEPGPAGGKALTQVTFVQRLNTKGGSAPADGCLVAGDVGKQVLVPYTADYYFYRAEN
jgi:hypothetical protein